MTKTTKKQTASEAYEARLAGVHAQIARIQEALKTHIDGKLHWGHVGDLGYVADELKSAADFLTGEGE